jgi:hypothetical protein
MSALSALSDKKTQLNFGCEWRHVQQKDDDIAVCECQYKVDDPESACGELCLNSLTNTECTPCHCPSAEFCRNQVMIFYQEIEVIHIRNLNLHNMVSWIRIDWQFISRGSETWEFYCWSKISSRQVMLFLKLIAVFVSAAFSTVWLCKIEACEDRWAWLGSHCRPGYQGWLFTVFLS